MEGIGTERIALLGLRAVGKSTAGAALARRLRWPFWDSDEELVRRHRHRWPQAEASAGGLLLHLGEARFRALELEVLEAVLKEPGPLVLATGGGAVELGPARALLADRARCVFLDAPLELLSERLVASGPRRPPLTDAPTPIEEMRRVSARRRPHYLQLAEVVVQVGQADESPDATALRIAAALWPASPSPT